MRYLELDKSGSVKRASAVSGTLPAIIPVVTSRARTVYSEMFPFASSFAVPAMVAVCCPAARRAVSAAPLASANAAAIATTLFFMIRLFIIRFLPPCVWPAQRVSLGGSSTSFRLPHTYSCASGRQALHVSICAVIWEFCIERTTHVSERIHHRSRPDDLHGIRLSRRILR